MTKTAEFTNDYGKRIEAEIFQDPTGEYCLRSIIINDTKYSSKQIRTAVRENVLLNYICQFIDLEELFYHYE